MSVRLLKNTVVILMLIFLTVIPAQAVTNNQSSTNLLVWGRVIKVISQVKSTSKMAGNGVSTQTLVIKLISGRFRGQLVTIVNTLGLNPVYDIKVAEGDGVVVALDIQNGKIKRCRNRRPSAGTPGLSLGSNFYYFVIAGRLE